MQYDVYSLLVTTDLVSLYHTKSYAFALKGPSRNVVVKIGQRRQSRSGLSSSLVNYFSVVHFSLRTHGRFFALESKILEGRMGVR